MVNYQAAALDRTFAALADPTRRALLAQLDDHTSRSVSELAQPFPVSLPAIMKHLDVLSDAGLIRRSKTGRTVTVELNAGPMEQAVNWLERYRRYWTDTLDRLAAFVEQEAKSWPANPSAPTSASPSSAASRRRRRKSTKPGRTRRK
jgi:DNA-binding transcriptional ArsR family regulator